MTMIAFPKTAAGAIAWKVDSMVGERAVTEETAKFTYVVSTDTGAVATVCDLPGKRGKNKGVVTGSGSVGYVVVHKGGTVAEGEISKNGTDLDSLSIVALGDLVASL